MGRLFMVMSAFVTRRACLALGQGEDFRVQGFLGNPIYRGQS